MIQKKTVLVCIFSDLSPDILHRYIVNAVMFAKSTGSFVHFLVPSNTEEAFNLELKSIPTETLKAIQAVSHLISEDLSSRVVNEAIKLYSTDLIVVQSGSVFRKEMLEQSSKPILLLSPNVDLVQTPIESVLVPMSGEIRVSPALKFGLRLASVIHVPVDLIHVTIQGDQAKCSLDSLGDQPGHEYRHLLDRVIAEATPFSDTKERARVRTLYHVQGIPSVEILKTAQHTPSCAIVAQWRGLFIQGRAETLKEILHQCAMPIFLIKAEADQKSLLKIGPETRVA